MGLFRLGENEVTVRNGRINQSTKFNNVQMELKFYFTFANLKQLDSHST